MYSQFNRTLENILNTRNLIPGGIFLLAGTLGLVSTCCSSSSFSYSFSLLLLLLVIGQILACLLLLLLSSQIHMLVAQILRLTMPLYSSSSSPLPSTVTATWDLVQASIPCCGVNSFYLVAMSFDVSPMLGMEFATAQLYLYKPDKNHILSFFASFLLPSHNCSCR